MVFWMGPCCARHHQYDTLDLLSDSQDHHPPTNSVQKTICCNSTSNALDDERMRPKHVELRIHQYNYLVASSWHFTLFHVEDARSNNPQISSEVTLNCRTKHLVAVTYYISTLNETRVSSLLRLMWMCSITSNVTFHPPLIFDTFL
jgi:hypothetical protein